MTLDHVIAWIDYHAPEVKERLNDPRYATIAHLYDRIRKCGATWPVLDEVELAARSMAAPSSMPELLSEMAEAIDAVRAELDALPTRIAYPGRVIR